MTLNPVSYRRRTSLPPKRNRLEPEYDITVPPPRLSRRARAAVRSRRNSVQGQTVWMAKLRDLSSKCMVYVAIAAFVAVLFLAIGKFAGISALQKQIAAINNQNVLLASQQENLEVELSMQNNVEKVTFAAVNKLGMIYPDETSIRVVETAGNPTTEARTQTADGSSQVNP